MFHRIYEKCNSNMIHFESPVFICAPFIRRKSYWIVSQRSCLSQNTLPDNTGILQRVFCNLLSDGF